MPKIKKEGRSIWKKKVVDSSSKTEEKEEEEKNGETNFISKYVLNFFTNILNMFEDKFYIDW